MSEAPLRRARTARALGEALRDGGTAVELRERVEPDLVRNASPYTFTSDVPPEQMRLVARKMKPVLDWRARIEPRMRWLHPARVAPARR